MSRVADDLIRAYRAAVYEIATGAGETIRLRIGEANADIDRVMAKAGASEAAVITAYNPASFALCEAENRAAHENLQGMLRELALRHLPSRGLDPSGVWPEEPGFLVLAVNRTLATTIARRFDQNGFVYIEVGAPPELVLVR